MLKTLHANVAINTSTLCQPQEATKVPVDPFNQNLAVMMKTRFWFVMIETFCISHVWL